MHKRLLTLARDARLPLSLTILAGFLGGLLIIWQASALSGVINRVYLQHRTLTDAWPSMRLLLMIFALRAALAWGSEITANAVALRVKTDLRERLFAHLLEMGPGYTRGERTGELATAAVDGVEALDAYYSQYLPQLVISAIVPLSILVFVFPLDPLSGLVLLLTAPLIPLFMVLIGRAAESLTSRQYETLSRLSAHFLDSLQGLTTLKQFGRSKAHAKTIAVVSDQFRDSTLKVLRVTFLSALALELLATLGVAIVAVEVGLRLLYGRMDFQQALFLLVLAPEFYIPLRMLGQRFHAGMAGTTAARRIFEILDAPVAAQNPVPDQTPQTRLAHPLRAGSRLEGLEFSDVSYSYPGQSGSALDTISLRIPAGQRIALVGASGAGKSTLASLLLRFAEPSSGQILADGQPLSAIPVNDWREQIAWVPQQPYLFHESLAANIRLAAPGASDESMAAAARAAHLDAFIESLPEKYETLIGEGGARLSGGQAQRLALARAFLKDAPILVLDEPTSSLDPELEALLEDSIRRLMAGRTVITIAHRLNTVFSADKIAVLDAGRIVETGSHAELIARNGVYAALIQSQLSNAGGTEAQDTAPTPATAQSAQDRSSSSFDLSLPTVAPTSGGPERWPSEPRARPRRLPTTIRLLQFLNGSWSRVFLSVLLGAATIGASIGLLGTSAYLISAAALHPSIAPHWRSPLWACVSLACHAGSFATSSVSPPIL